MEVRILKNSYSYSEVLDIIDNMEVKYKEMLPRKLMDFLNENKNLEYKKHVNPQIPLSEQNISKDAITILAMINLKYWVKDEKHKADLIEKYKDHPNIKIYSQDAEKGKTLEYDLMLCNSASDLLLVSGLSNKDEIKELQAAAYPACLERLRASKENERIKESLNGCSWSDEDKKKALLAARYLNSVGKGENALELSIALRDNLAKQEAERKNFTVPQYIEDALTWLLQ